MKFSINPEKVKYLKIVYKDKNDTEHFTKAVAKHIEDREIVACIKFDDSLNIETPQDISLSFVCNDGLYKATTTLKSVVNAAPYIIFNLKTPENLEYQQIREFFRVKMEGDVILKFEGKTVSSKIYDISANGIRVKIDEDIKIPDNVELDIIFSDKNIKTSAKFVRTDEEDGIIKASFAYQNISELNRDTISQKCILKQLEDKRNSVGN